MNSNKTLLPDRGILRLSGNDKVQFLQGLISNDVMLIAPEKALYACLLTPQGKFLHDFFIVQYQDDWLIDCERDRADDLLKRLSMYKLRSNVTLDNVSDQFQVCITFEKPDNTESVAITDPRHAGMGWRIYQTEARQEFENASLFSYYERKRITFRIPDGSRDMEPGKALIMEYGLDKLNAVDFNKGCYLGQEMTSRMFFRDMVKKNLFVFYASDPIPATGTPVTQDNKDVGEVRTHFENKGLALLKIDAAKQGDLFCGDTQITLDRI